MAREIRFYRTASGRCPVGEFLDALRGRQAQKVAWVLALIEELDIVPARYFKKLPGSEGLWEVRVDVGRDTFRLLAFFDGPRVVVLTHGFAKKTQKVPAREIALAERRRAEYLRRNRP
jgi:phage-related protein